MLFNSFEFFLFFPIVTILYFLLPHGWRWFHLLVASCIFYMAFMPVYILILLATIIIDYIAGLLIAPATGSRRKWYLALSIVANVGVLAYFKYYNFFADNISGFFGLLHVGYRPELLHIILPIGLSFHTFQAMSYTIEVYRGNQKPERHLGIYTLYVMFYPQLAAGPIERPQNVLHQFHERHRFSHDNMVAGLRMMLWGLFKKAVIADNLARIADPVFNDPHSYNGITMAIATVLFAIQIYCDFSGYSEIALGTARVMGFHLMTNFNHPYHARSISEFWRRWHISLSTWFSDYLHGPLSLSLRTLGKYAVIISVMVTFLTSGLWHGADWKFVVWGGLHGLALAYEILTKKARKKFFKKLPAKLADAIGIAFTFSYVCLVYTFFRARNVHDAWYMVRKILAVPADMARGIASVGIAPVQLLYAALMIGMLEAYYWVAVRNRAAHWFSRAPFYARWAAYYLVALSIIFLGVTDNRQFIYFQF